ncbi:DNA replication licensing factor MCM2-like [Pyrus communis]|uniref:DNA replication licensing factor MCM2-like n=1 Tax=Pyrus communis TaxID=23211 RepID=UPI0035C048C2
MAVGMNGHDQLIMDFDEDEYISDDDNVDDDDGYFSGIEEEDDYFGDEYHCDQYYCFEFGQDLKFEKMLFPEGTIKEWVAKDEVRRFIAEKFKKFLLTFVNHHSKNVQQQHDETEVEYVRLINQMVSANKCSLVINYEQLLPVQIQIARWMIKSPRLILETFEDAAKNVVLNLHPNYKNVHPSIYVRITNLRKCVSIRNISETHLDALICIRGLVTRCSNIFPKLQQATSSSRNYQILTLQESSGSVPACRLPRCVEVIVSNDLIDSALSGDEIEVTGIYTDKFDLSLNANNGTPEFATVVEANYIAKTKSRD